jgi:hypothetical protein
MKRFFTITLLIVAFAALFTACSETEQEPYKTVTLREATRGQVVSKEFKYKLVNPEIVAMHRNLALVREGNLVEIVAARSLADKLEGLTDGYYELNVIKKFSPYVHFKVDRIATETDTVFPAQAGSIAYPRITSAEEYGIDEYEDTDTVQIPYNNAGVLRPLVGKKLKVDGIPITIETAEGKPFFVLHGERGKFRVADPLDGTTLILKILAENNWTFNGGVILTEVEGYNSRIKSQTAGTVEVKWVMYGDRLITG